ncbi:unnamed protein product, partial [Ectocarpus sp. 12 AP-2014]
MYIDSGRYRNMYPEFSRPSLHNDERHKQRQQINEHNGLPSSPHTSVAVYIITADIFLQHLHETIDTHVLVTKNRCRMRPSVPSSTREAGTQQLISSATFKYEVLTFCFNGVSIWLDSAPPLYHSLGEILSYQSQHHPQRSGISHLYTREVSTLGTEKQNRAQVHCELRLRHGSSHGHPPCT